MGITKFVLKRPVTAILGFLCLLVFGYQSITGATLEMTPETDMSMMIIYTTYPGASPDDVNELVTKEIEDKVSTLSGLDTVSSTSSEGASMVILQYDYGTDMDKAYDDLKKKVDQLADILPDDAGTPSITEMNANADYDMTLVIENSAKSKDEIYSYVKNDIVPEFEKLSDAAEVTVSGGSDEFIKVQLNGEKMKQYGITMSSLAADIKAADLTYPAGTTKVGNQNLSLSTKMNFDTVELLNEVPLTTSGSDVVYLQDVSDIFLTSEGDTSISRYNGKNTVTMDITKQQSSSSMKLSEAVKEEITALEEINPDLSINIIADAADSIQDSLISVVETLFLAIVISMIIIWLFFGDLKASLIVGSSIPVSILTALICMRQMDITLNVITLNTLTLGVGMMVDNSIVVMESCFRVSSERKGGFAEYMKDALEGTNIVGSSVIASTTTTCVVFLPLAFMNGLAGQLFGPLGFTIVFCMVASLISAISVVPLCYMLYKPVERDKAPFSRPIKALQDTYRKAMKVILPKKKTVMISSILLLLSAFLLATNLEVELMASDDQGQISINVETRPGLDSEKVDKIMQSVETTITGHEDLESYVATYGSGGMNDTGDIAITAFLKDGRNMSTEEVIRQWKRELAVLPDCNATVEKKSTNSASASSEEGYEAIIKGADYDEVKNVSDQAVSKLMERSEVTKVHSDAENSSPVVEVTVDALKAKANGLTAAAIGSEINHINSGIEATEIEVNGQNLSVMVEYADDEYETLDQISNITLTTGNGGSVALTDVADIQYKNSPSSIERENKEYEITISADYTELADKSTEETLNREIVEPLLSKTITKGLNSTDQMMQNEFSSLFGALATAVFLIFVVMAAQFESPKFSLMVMTTIPFSLIGSFGLLWLTDCKISMVSLVGFMMLIGTVVNNGILYVDTVNQYRLEMDQSTALIEAGATRMRPILMTTLTTIIAMIPMAMALGNAGSMTQGLAIVNIGGLTASTILSLLMLPVFYSVMSPALKKEKGNKESMDEN